MNSYFNIIEKQFRKFEDKTSKLHTRQCKYEQNCKYFSTNTCYFLHFKNELNDFDYRNPKNESTDIF